MDNSNQKTELTQLHPDGEAPVEQAPVRPMQVDSTAQAQTEQGASAQPSLQLDDESVERVVRAVSPSLNAMKVNAKRRTAEWFKERRERTKQRKMAEGTWTERRPRASKKHKGTEKATSSTSAMKRPRSETSTPPSSGKKPQNKRQKPESAPGVPIARAQAQTFAEKAKAVKMAVYPESYPSTGISEEHFLELKTILLSKMKPLATGLFPQFTNCRVEASAAVFACANAESRTWLEETVATVGTWKGFRLCCSEARKVINMEKIIFKLPSEYNSTRIERGQDGVLTHIEKFNGISTEDWRVLNATADDSGRKTVCISVTEKDLCMLKEKQLKLFLGFEQIQVKVLVKKSVEKSSSDGPQDPSDKPTA